VLSAEESTSVFPSMVIPREGDFAPVQMEIQEASSERGHIPARVCLLGRDGQTYRVFALPEKL
jgi:anaphase-promoting complex subunit 4